MTDEERKAYLTGIKPRLEEIGRKAAELSGPIVLEDLHARVEESRIERLACLSTCQFDDPNHAGYCHPPRES